jgi:CNT family concentrative nucleoside transporter
MLQLQAVCGIFVFIGVAMVLSTDRRSIKWRPIIVGVILQLLVAVLLFRMPGGLTFFRGVNDGVVGLLDHARKGAYLVFNQLAVPPGMVGDEGEPSLGFFLAFQGLPTIIFFSALMSVLYFVGIMPLILKGFSYVFTKVMRTSGAESLCAGSNVFVGIESVFSIRPYLSKMTKSELHMILTAGMATIASSVLGFYTFILQQDFPMIAGHLVSASLLSAPAAVVMSKLLCPETGEPVTMGKVVEPEKLEAKSLIEAILTGANEGMKLTLSIVALLIAFVGLVSLVNGIIGWVGGGADTYLGLPLKEMSLQKVLGWIFYPFTVLIGINPGDVREISTILGERSVLTEVVSYKHLAAMLANGELIDPERSSILASYALCGFAHVAAIAIFVGGISSLVPQRAAEIARLGFRAMIAATLACFQTAAVAGIFVSSGSSILFGG